MLIQIREFKDFLKYESKFGMRVLLFDLLMINKLYFRDVYVKKLLKFAQYNQYKFTFFIRSYDLDKKTKLLKKLQKQGHEIACHGHSHELYGNKSKNWLIKEINLSKKLFLSQGIDVHGFRSPFLSETKIMYSILEKLGFRYVSNRFNINSIDCQDTKFIHDELIYPSDWHGLIVEKFDIKTLVNEWRGKKGTLLLHPWIFLKHLNVFKTILNSNNKDFRIIKNLGIKSLNISFDLY